jgi:predicted PurR-regulated permease PerM
MISDMNEPENKNAYYLPIIAVLILLFLLYLVRRVVTPFFISFALAYLLDPLVDRLESLKIPRTAGVLLLMFFFSGVLLLGGIILIPLFQLQAHELTVKLPDYIKTLQTWIHPLLAEVSGFDSAKIQEMLNVGLKRFGELPLHIVSDASSFLWSSLSNLFNILLMAFNLVVIPVVTFYLLRDFDVINRKINDLIPRRFQGKAAEIILEIDGVLSRFVRGQMLVAFFMAVLYSIGLFLCGTPLGLFIGAFAGFANMVPYLGLVFGLLPAAALTFLHYQQVMPIFWVAGVFGAAHALESVFITPRVMGGQIGLHPVVIMLAVLIGAEFFGLLGIILAVPLTAVLNVLLRRGLTEYKKSFLYS